MTLDYTRRFRFGLPDFLSGPWHNDWYALVNKMDETLYNIAVLNGANIWLNSTVYSIGAVVISPEDGSLWSCAVAHTSAVGPTTFSQDRAANPTFWNGLSVSLAVDIGFTPVGDIAATNVQDAIAEVDAEKAALVHTHTIANVINLQSSLDAKAPLASPIFTGSVTSIGLIIARGDPLWGFTGLSSGTLANPGYIEFRTPDGLRRGYVGWANGTDLTLTSENGWGWNVIDGTFKIAGVPVYTNIPQRSVSAATTLDITDAQKHIFHPAADTTARIWTIPANASVPFPIGSAVTFVNEGGAGVITIAITSDTLVLAGVGSTGSRTLAANGIATAIKVTATKWMISGTGLT